MMCDMGHGINLILWLAGLVAFGVLGYFWVDGIITLWGYLSGLGETANRHTAWLYDLQSEIREVRLKLREMEKNSESTK